MYYAFYVIPVTTIKLNGTLKESAIWSLVLKSINSFLPHRFVIIIIVIIIIHIITTDVVANSKQRYVASNLSWLLHQVVSRMCLPLFIRPTLSSDRPSENVALLLHRLTLSSSGKLPDDNRRLMGNLALAT